MADLTRIHFRGDTTAALIDAVLRLTRHARESNDDFTFGPVSITALLRDGLTLTGPDLTDPLAILAAVPGLAQVDH